MVFSTDLTQVDFKPGSSYNLVLNSRYTGIYESREPIKIFWQEGLSRDPHGTRIPNVLKCNLYALYSYGTEWVDVRTFLAPSRHTYPTVMEAWNGATNWDRFSCIEHFLASEAFRFKDTIRRIHINHAENALDLVTSVAYHYLNNDILNSAMSFYDVRTDATFYSTLLGRFLYSITHQTKYLNIPSVAYSVA